jgi:hypothetical protein
MVQQSVVPQLIPRGVFRDVTSSGAREGAPRVITSSKILNHLDSAIVIWHRRLVAMSSAARAGMLNGLVILDTHSGFISSIFPSSH